MSGIVAGSAVAAIATVATVVVASFPDALSPLAGTGTEYAVAAVLMLATIPMLAAMAVLSTSGRE